MSISRVARAIGRILQITEGLLGDMEVKIMRVMIALMTIMMLQAHGTDLTNEALSTQVDIFKTLLLRLDLVLVTKNRKFPRLQFRYVTVFRPKIELN